MTKTSSVPRRFPARSRSPTSSRRSTKPPTSVDGFTPLETTATRASPPFVSGSPFVRRLDLVETNTHPSRRVPCSFDRRLGLDARSATLSLSLSLVASRLVASRRSASPSVAGCRVFSKNSRARRGDRPAAFVVVVVVVRRPSDVDGERVR